MNRRQLVILILCGIALGVVGILMSRRNAASWTAAEAALGRKVLGSFPVNDVTRVRIKDGQGEVDLVKEDEWRVTQRYNYPASFSAIRDLIRKAADLKAVQTLKVGSSQLGRLDLVTPGRGTNAGTLVEFKDAGGKVLRSFLLGKKHMRQPANNAALADDTGWPDGRYVMVLQPAAHAAPNVDVVADPLTSIEAKPEQWLDKGFFKVEKLQSVAVLTSNPTNSWKVYRQTENGVLKLAQAEPGEKLDPSKIYGIGDALSDPSFNDVVSPTAKLSATGLDHPIVATLKTFDHFTYTVRIGKSTKDDNYYFHVSVKGDLSAKRVPAKGEKPADKARLDREFQAKTEQLKAKLLQEEPLGKWTYLVSKWTIDPLLKVRKDLLETPPPPKTKPAKTTPAAPKPPTPPAPKPSVKSVKAK